MQRKSFGTAHPEHNFRAQLYRDRVDSIEPWTSMGIGYEVARQLRIGCRCPAPSTEVPKRSHEVPPPVSS